MIATFANSLRSEIYRFSIVNLVIIIVAVYAIYKIFTQTRLSRKLTDILRANIIKKEIIKSVSFEELVVATGGYGVSSIEVCENSPVLGKTLRNADLRKYDITILAIERKGETISNPPADMKILLGDRLICFGKLEKIREELCKV